MNKLTVLLLALLTLPLQASEYLIGQMQPWSQVVIKAEVDGVVAAIDAELGDHVEAGQLLLQFEATDARLQQQLATANVALAAADHRHKAKQLERLQQLSQQHTIAIAERDEQWRQVDVSHSQLQVEQQYLQIAERQLAKHQLRAPAAAAVVARYAEVGQRYSVGDPLLLLADLRQLRVQAFAVEQDITSLSVGQMLCVSVDSLPPRQLPIARIAAAPAVDGRGYLLELDWDNHDGALRSGYRAELSLPQQGQCVMGTER
ncbi:efflux RND transporter periplasmic adaptor subunit [Ferrimonas senticii]|uniref:efflux RND transporter periplasmic adaptor subunit n=1 Tax=Ferrimonas senticii TaxID=394566 RepID=UPI00040F6C5E|nr:efflux RND transporter periplasmic adaptor subunit [Ferrimonas senticii]